MGRFFRQDFLPLADGTRIYYQLLGEPRGDAPAMVLCDGLGCDGFAWKYLAPYLARHHRVLRWHYRGHGRSSVPRDLARLGMLYTCDDLARLMDATGLRQAVLFGHSIGVQVALEFHRRHARRVKGLVLICGSYGNPLDTFHDSTVLKRLFPLLRRTVERYPRPAARLVRAVLSTELAMQVAILVELNRERIARQDMVPYFKHLASMDPVVFVRTLESMAQHSARDHLPYVDVPTLIIGGGRDKFTPVRLSREMARDIPGAELLLLPQGTHTVPLEYRDTVELQVGRFLQGRLGLSPPPGTRG
ncbi:Pimeloyl-ACP methyl ester carboxylesterase [Stigmatella aurantiaca]|uniref:Pimeloyl-ACP methyl ester carboxylesterase n=1 Tax=Stigmatella aurantiaca TaxID=41 RepID=A0A1H7W1I1_STIAU|nr:alpha/beta hydrolase [Stigmatella aurantiaca]SEM14959.1 Pimeloyl-ACP methyl ester carboxylesterase [Stigmatella aurantiaca]